MINSYNLLSRYYDKIYSKKPYKKEIIYINRLLNRKKFKKVLEVGCGTGNYTHWINKIFNPEKLLCIDVNAKMLDLAKKKKILGVFQKKNILKFNSYNEYDIIFCLFHVINYFQKKTDYEKFIKNCYNLLSKNGYLVFDCLSSDNISNEKPISKKIVFKYKNSLIRRNTISNVSEKKNFLLIKHIYSVNDKKKVEEKYKLRLVKKSLIKQIIKDKFKIHCNYEWLTYSKPSKKNWSDIYVLKKNDL